MTIYAEPPTRTNTQEIRTSSAQEARRLVPVLGYRNYWYPAFIAKKVKAGKPVSVMIAGEKVVRLGPLGARRRTACLFAGRRAHRSASTSCWVSQRISSS